MSCFLIAFHNWNIEIVRWSSLVQNRIWILSRKYALHVLLFSSTLIHLPFFIGNLVRSIHKSKHNTHKKNQTSAGLVARSFFYRSVCMFTRFTSLHLLQSTSITTGGLERPMYTLATVEERRIKKNRLLHQWKLLGKKSAHSRAIARNNTVSAC